MLNNDSLKEIARVFLRLGIIGFGGPAAHIAMMEAEVVRKRKWFSGEHFLDMVAATNLIPGPNSTEMAMHCGQERSGWKGLVVAGFCFITPAVLITGFIAWAYRRYGNLPDARPFIYGIQPAIIAYVVSVMIRLARKSVKSIKLTLLGCTAAILALMGCNEIILLFGGGFLAVLLYIVRSRPERLHSVSPMLLISAGVISDEKIFWAFLKIGALLYGSGYVLFAFLDGELVAKGIISRQVLIDAIAVGQFTPGPVFSSATFIGWQIGGLPGAIAATAGIFLPSFLFVFLLKPLIRKLRSSREMSAFLDAVGVISLALIFAVCVEMGRAAILDWRTAAIALAGLLVTFIFPRLNSALVVLGGALAGYGLSFC